MGCSVGTIKKIETDVRRPSRQMADRLADMPQIGQGERADFLRVARAELATDQLALDTEPVASVPALPMHFSAPSNNFPAQPTP